MRGCRWKRFFLTCVLTVQQSVSSEVLAATLSDDRRPVRNRRPTTTTTRCGVYVQGSRHSCLWSQVRQGSEGINIRHYVDYYGSGSTQTLFPMLGRLYRATRHEYLRRLYHPRGERNRRLRILRAPSLAPSVCHSMRGRNHALIDYQSD